MVCCASLSLCFLFFVLNFWRTGLQSEGLGEQGLQDTEIPTEGAVEVSPSGQDSPFFKELSSSVDASDSARLVGLVLLFVLATGMFAYCLRDEEQTVLVVKADATLAQGLEVAQSEWRAVSARNGHVQPTLLQREWATSQLSQEIQR